MRKQEQWCIEICGAKTVNKDMGSGVKVLLVLQTICSISLQQPLLSKNTYKGLTGIISTARLSSSGFQRVVYYHDQTVAIVDINQKNEMQNCDIIEV